MNHCYNVFQIAHSLFLIDSSNTTTYMSMYPSSLFSAGNFYDHETDSGELGWVGVGIVRGEGHKLTQYEHPTGQEEFHSEDGLELQLDLDKGMRIATQMPIIFEFSFLLKMQMVENCP